jgi:hypothetical protein
MPGTIVNSLSPDISVLDLAHLPHLHLTSVSLEDSGEGRPRFPGSGSLLLYLLVEGMPGYFLDLRIPNGEDGAGAGILEGYAPGFGFS